MPSTCPLLRASSHRYKAVETLLLPTADRYLLSYVHIDSLDFPFRIGAVFCILGLRKRADGMNNLPPGFISVTTV